jgi:hypothetical protein
MDKVKELMGQKVLDMKLADERQGKSLNMLADKLT